MQNITQLDAIPTVSKTAVALGIFDGVHMGHRKVLCTAVEEAKKRSLSSCVFTFNTASVTTKSGALLCEKEKHRRIEKIGIDYVFSPNFSELKGLSPESFVKEILVQKLNCGVAVCGEDFRFGNNASGDCDILKALGRKYGFDVIAVPQLKYCDTAVSTTLIKSLLKNGETQKANTLLCEPLSYTEKVVHGIRLGKEMGFPTINQPFSQELSPVKYGVYCSEVTVNGQRYAGVTNIGVKPTVKSDNVPVIETHIVGFDGDLYGEEVRLELLSFVRAEKCFDGVDELKKQITADTESVCEYYCPTN